MLEHPAYSDAFATFGLPIPSRSGGWQRGFCGGWSAHVEQWHYGHRAKKATWLYAFGVPSLPSLRWGSTPDGELTAYATQETGVQRGRRKARPPALISWCGNHTAAGEDRPRLGSKEASRTPLGFRDELLSIARSVPVEMQSHAERSRTPPRYA